MSGTNLKYNGVTLKNCQTLRFDQTIEYDESHTDAMYHKFVVRVSGSVHPEQQYHHGFQFPGTSPATAVDATILIQQQLQHPRGELEYSVGGQVLLAANANPTTPFLDVNNGPKPTALSVTRVYGRQLLSVEFEIEVCRVYCGTLPVIPGLTYGAGANARVLNNRWSLTEEFDRDFYSVLTLEGTLRVSHIAAYPHLFRYLCMPPLKDGYRRESMRFVDSADGLVLKYQVTDRQMYAAPPTPATSWEATYTESSGVGGAVGLGEVSVRLTGAPETPKRDLIAAAFAVVQARVGNLQKVFEQQGYGDNAVLLKHAAIVENLHDNTIQVIAQVQYSGNDAKVFNARIAQMGEPLTTAIAGYNPKKWPSPGVWQWSAPHGLLAKYLQSPCLDIHGLPTIQPITPEGSDQNPGRYDADSGTEVLVYEGTPTSTNDDDPSGASAEQKGSFPYTYCLVENDYNLRDGYIQLPVARFGGAGAPAAPQPSCVLIPIHAPISNRSIVVHAERVGDWPDFPEPFVTGLDFNGIPQARTRRRVITEVPELLADGKTRLYKAQIRINYAMERAPENTEIFAGGGSPVDESTPADNAIDGTKHFVSGVYI